MNAAQNLSEGYIKCAKAGLSVRRRVAFMVMSITLMNLAVCAVRLAAGMPCRMHDRALLRDKQQEYAKVMEKPARHQGLLTQVRKITTHTTDYYLAVVSTASVSR